MTPAEARNLLGAARLVRRLGLLSVAVTAPTLPFIWSDLGPTYGAVMVGVLVLLVVDCGLLVPWMFASIVRRRGIHEGR